MRNYLLLVASMSLTSVILVPIRHEARRCPSRRWFLRDGGPAMPAWLFRERWSDPQAGRGADASTPCRVHQGVDDRGQHRLPVIAERHAPLEQHRLLARPVEREHVPAPGPAPGGSAWTKRGKTDEIRMPLVIVGYYPCYHTGNSPQRFEINFLAGPDTLWADPVARRDTYGCDTTVVVIWALGRGGLGKNRLPRPGAVWQRATRSGRLRPAE